MGKLIENSSDFMFIYDASQCNPNGDPDQENKPRMDYDTATNLVTDTRVKRYIRDYLKLCKGEDIFVAMEDNTKVSVDHKLEAIVLRTIQDEEELKSVFHEDSEALKYYQDIIKTEKDETKIWNAITKSKKTKDKNKSKENGKTKTHKQFNYKLLSYLIRKKFIDIRMFGGAFAASGFNEPYTGAIQLNWGYSFNQVEIMESNSIVTIMNDDDSTFGKDYRVYYSLLGFHGTINNQAAQSTGLSKNDLDVFREAIWQAIPANPTRSKLNQYPKLYVEIVYQKGVTNGQFGDLRNYVSVKPAPGLTDKKVRRYSHLEVDFTQLIELIKKNRDGEGKIIQDVIVKQSPDVDFQI